MTHPDNPRAVIGHNQPDPIEVALSAIQDLYDEAKNFADGEPITSPEMHDAIEKLYDGIHDAGRKAEALRVEAKRPHDEAAAAVQAKFNPYKKKVDTAKAALSALLTPWRTRLACEKEEAARLARLEADRIAAEATAAIRASAGDLAARERAEELLKEAKVLDRVARKEDRGATQGTGLRTVWKADLVQPGVALDWAWERDAARFTALVQSMADEAVRLGARTVPGFVVRAQERAI